MRNEAWNTFESAMDENSIVWSSSYQSWRIMDGFLLWCILFTFALGLGCLHVITMCFEIRHVFVLKWCFGKSVESIQQSWAMHTNASLIWYERRALTVKWYRQPKVFFQALQNSSPLHVNLSQQFLVTIQINSYLYYNVFGAALRWKQSKLGIFCFSLIRPKDCHLAQTEDLVSIRNLVPLPADW